MEKILTIEDVANSLGVAENTVRKAIVEGTLKAFKRFGKWYIFESDVTDFIRSGDCSTDRKTKAVK